MIEGTLNDGAIGDGIGVRHAGLNDRGTHPVRRLNELAARGWVRKPGREVRQQRAAARVPGGL